MANLAADEHTRLHLSEPSNCRRTTSSVQTQAGSSGLLFMANPTSHFPNIIIAWGSEVAPTPGLDMMTRVVVHIRGLRCADGWMQQ